MNADDGTEEPGNERNCNPNADGDFDAADENEAVTEGWYTPVSNLVMSFAHSRGRLCKRRLA